MTSTIGGRDARLRELAENLQHVRERIAAACLAAGRPVEDVVLIAITKMFPAPDVVLLAELGVTDVGENRDQEAVPKVAEVGAMYAGAGALRWHFVGALQTNKCASVVRYASLVHSVDRLRLVDALGHPTQEGAVHCLVQVDLDETSRPGRGGARPDEVGAIADAIAANPRLELAGVMAVAPLGADPDPAFRKLAEIADGVRQRHPMARSIQPG